MKVFIFLGPTLSGDEAHAHLDAAYLPPVAQGDVFRVAKQRPFAIGIIDGYFERLPAVWHKEILWAITQGVHVFGAASMGALRAAELAKFGMKGVGAIFDAFNSGALEDDDEVAVAHGDASTGYRATSEAMVNIRATLRSAQQSEVVSADVRDRLEVIAKSLFYPDRSYAYLFARAVEQGAPAREIDALRAFLLKNRVDQKRTDAIALLAALKECCEAGAPPSPPLFSFAHTEAWDEVVDWAETQPPLLKESEGVPADLIAAEVRLSGQQGRGLLATGVTRAVAGVLARRSGIADREERTTKLDRGLREGISGREDERKQQRFEHWLDERGLTPEGYRGFLERQVAVDWLRERFRDDVDRHVVDEVRLTGEYGGLSRRALGKQTALAERGLAEPTLKDAGLSASELLCWYFEHRIGRPIPVDLDAFLIENGVPDVAALQREALREFLYSRLSTSTK